MTDSYEQELKDRIAELEELRLGICEKYPRKCRATDKVKCFNCMRMFKVLASFQKLKEEMPRAEIMEFAQEMERIMRKHDAKKGDSWKTCDVGFLRDKLHSEYREANTLHSEPSELVDLANVAMMLWQRKLKDFMGSEKGELCPDCGVPMKKEKVFDIPEEGLAGAEGGSKATLSNLGGQASQYGEQHLQIERSDALVTGKPTRNPSKPQKEVEG